MAAQGGYSYYASQTVRTLRGFLDAGVNATGWSSGTSVERDASGSLRPAETHERDGAMPGMPRRAGGAGKKSSRPGVGQLFDGLQREDATSAGDQADGVEVRHRVKTDSDNSNNFKLDRVLFHTGSARDPYNTESQDEIPLLALCPCNLPTELSELVVSQLTARLDSYAQEPYMLVVFASPSNPIPVQHLIRYYRGLSSEVRRNVQRIWTCHAGLFTKIAVRLFLNTIVSGKVTRKGKVKLVDSLNSLGQDLDLSRIEIPPEVLIHDYKTNGKLSVGRGTSPVFGASLSHSMTDDKLPLPIHQALQHLRTSSHLRTVGLFRKVPSITILDVCKGAFDSNIPIKFSQWPDSAILAGSIMKNYLRCLKYPIFPSGMYEIIRKCPVEESEAVRYIKEKLIPTLEEEHPDGRCVGILLEEILRLLSEVAAYKDANQMDSHNLAVVFLPVLVRSADIRQDAFMCTMPRKVNLDRQMKEQKEQQSSLGMILKLCIDRYDEIFPPRHDVNGQEKQTMTRQAPESSRSASASSKSSAEPSSERSHGNKDKRTVRRNHSGTLKLLGSPGTVRKNMNGKAARSEATRESARGLFANT